MQTRGSRVTEVLAKQDVNEIADSEPGTVNKIHSMIDPKLIAVAEPNVVPVTTPVKISYANVDSKGQVEFSSKET